MPPACHNQHLQRRDFLDGIPLADVRARRHPQPITTEPQKKKKKPVGMGKPQPVTFRLASMRSAAQKTTVCPASATQCQ